MRAPTRVVVPSAPPQPCNPVYFSTTTTTTVATTAPSSLAPTRVPVEGIRAHGPTGDLLVLLAPPEKRAALKSAAVHLPELVLTRRQLCDVEMLLNGGFTPLHGFMTQREYDSVVRNMRLPDGTLFPMPITLDVSAQKAHWINEHKIKQLALKDEEGNIIAVLDVHDVYQPDRQLEAQLVFGGDPEHPAIRYLNHTSGTHYIGGALTGLQLPPHYDHVDIRETPLDVRASFAANGWQRVVAFQTRNPLHRAHFELTVRACADHDAHLLLHPVVGMTKPGDIDHHTRVKCYRAIMSKYAPGTARLSALPLAMRMGGPREAIWHAIIRQNYGATHFIIGRDHAGPGANSHGRDFYGPYDARDEALKYQSELAIRLVPFDMMVYVPSEDKYYAAAEVDKSTKTEKLSGTEVRRRLQTGEEIPAWFSYPEVVRLLRIAHPPRHKQGVCLLFTGLSGSGKSTIANALLERLMSIDSRPTVLLDGDRVRQMLSSELGFSPEHRNLNIRRIGYVSSLVVKAGGLVIAAPIAPYAASRRQAREYCEQFGGFVEVFVATPLEVCEKRDRKGLYEKVRKGALKNFTGVDDPYEVPESPDIRIGEEHSVQSAVDAIIAHLRKHGYLTADETL